jgi:hypothetical protein
MEEQPTAQPVPRTMEMLQPEAKWLPRPKRPRQVPEEQPTAKPAPRTPPEMLQPEAKWLLRPKRPAPRWVPEEQPTAQPVPRGSVGKQLKVKKSHLIVSDTEDDDQVFKNAQDEAAGFAKQRKCRRRDGTTARNTDEWNPLWSMPATRHCSQCGDFTYVRKGVCHNRWCVLNEKYW